MDTINVLIWGHATDGPCAYFRGYQYEEALKDYGIDQRNIQSLDILPEDGICVDVSDGHSCGKKHMSIAEAFAANKMHQEAQRGHPRHADLVGLGHVAAQPAVRLVAFGKDTMNVISFLASAQSAQAYQAIPLYDIKGSVSQFDENLIKNQKDLGIGFSPFINLGIARDAASSMLALDLSVLTTSDMAVLPRVASRNSVVILKQGRGFDGDAAYHKFGINYSMTLARSEGQSQALRGLVELATVELVGKLTKTPYWSCLGVTDPMANEETRLEMFDWYHAMAATRVELIAYFQNQLRRRGFYDGPIDGEFNAAIDEAIATTAPNSA